MYSLRQLDELKVELLGGPQSTDVSLERPQRVDVVGLGQDATQTPQPLHAQLHGGRPRRRRHSGRSRAAAARQGAAQRLDEFGGRRAELMQNNVDVQTALTVQQVHLQCKKGKRSPYSITERRVPELIPVLGSQPAGDVSHKPGGRLPLLSARPAVTFATLKRLLPISLLGEQRHDGCEQFA